MSAGSAGTEEDRSGAEIGERLRHERERRGWSVAQVAEDLHLDIWAIEALESGRFAALGPPVFVKGHLHKYATLLELDVATLVSLYEMQRESAPTLAPLSLVMRMGGRRRWIAVVGVLILLGAVALAGWLWWLQR